jgi:molybdopterin molybdotransferase
MVAFELFARPALLALQRALKIDRPRAPVTLARGYAKPAGRAHYLRAQLERRGAVLHANIYTKQGSGMLSSMIGIDALVEIDAETTELPPGGKATALLLRAV